MPWAAESDASQSPIVWVAKAAGARRVVADIPTGDSAISPRVTMARLPSSHSGLASSSLSEGMTRRRKESPARQRPMENFCGVEGWRLPSRIHSAAMNGVERISTKEPTDWYQEEGLVKHSAS